MPKAAVSPAQQELNRIETQIAAKKADLAEFVEALNLAESKARWTPSPGQLPAWDRLQELLANTPREEHQRALELAQGAVDRGGDELRDLEGKAKLIQAGIDRDAAIAKMEPIGAELNRAAQAYLDALAKWSAELANTPEIRPWYYSKGDIKLAWVRQPSPASNGPLSFERLLSPERPEQAI